MREHSSATVLPEPVILPVRHNGTAASRTSTGIWWGLLGVAAFSFTVPLTRMAVAGLSPLFIGSGRAVVAGVLAAAALALTRQRLPQPRTWARLALVAGGVVVGFPLLTSYALTAVPAGHGAVVIALLPAATATAAILRTRERPRAAFWAVMALGSLAALAFAFLQSGGIGHLHWADLLLLGAVVCAAVGYAEGGLLARELGSWQTIAWALVLAFPPMLALAVFDLARQPPSATPAQWAAFAYLAVVSMFLGFFAWYRGLAIGPMAQVSQIQLLQPVLSICWAALLLGEAITWTTVIGGLAVILCAGAAVRVRLKPKA
ncbi:DMT family transporter [Pseudarthrobacter sp. SL88]|uniref:DMT family transporter n=1 Tax=Pseudarthrobacter sp. SL88 TaxID=2994666 RepID=UPI0022727A00|nr:DMT family transporter [Pseudarthrobacter sp. SL88]MCY1675556.1 DMT family transporter [Pseudarthrobacter sp. SL88]